MIKWCFNYSISSDGLKFRAYLTSKHYIIATTRKSHRLGIRQLKKILEEMHSIKVHSPNGTKKIVCNWFIRKEGDKVYLEPLKIVVNPSYAYKAGISASKITFPQFTLKEVEDSYNRALKDMKEGKVKELRELSKKLEKSFGKFA